MLLDQFLVLVLKLPHIDVIRKSLVLVHDPFQVGLELINDLLVMDILPSPPFNLLLLAFKFLLASLVLSCHHLRDFHHIAQGLFDLHVLLSQSGQSLKVLLLCLPLSNDKVLNGLKILGLIFLIDLSLILKG